MKVVEERTRIRVFIFAEFPVSSREDKVKLTVFRRNFDPQTLTPLPGLNRRHLVDLNEPFFLQESAARVVVRSEIEKFGNGAKFLKECFHQRGGSKIFKIDSRVSDNTRNFVFGIFTSAYTLDQLETGIISGFRPEFLTEEEVEKIKKYKPKKLSGGRTRITIHPITQKETSHALEGFEICRKIIGERPAIRVA